MRTTEQVAEYLGLSSGTLCNWRSQGRGPKFIKIGGSVRYTDEALEAFIHQSERQSTAQGKKP